MRERMMLIGYAAAFASFLLDSEIGEKIGNIIVFGSVARGDYGKDSDIDLFIDTASDIEKGVSQALALFRMSAVQKTWELKGVHRDISVKVGSLARWSLRREVISSGILLYGKYSALPEKMKYMVLMRLDMKGMTPAKQVRIWRKLYGYKQKIGRKTYTGRGLVQELGGTKVGKAVILVPMEKRVALIRLLNNQHVKYTLNEVWSDVL